MESMVEKTTQTPAVGASRQMLRHTLATLAYRGSRALQGAPESFAAFQEETGRNPLQIVAHMGDLFDWALSCAQGKQKWQTATPKAWPQEVKRFFTALRAFDDYLASDLPLGYPVEKLFQGAVADALTHVGQINLLRRLAGCPIKGENYFVAEITTGRVGEEQAVPVRQF